MEFKAYSAQHIGNLITENVIAGNLLVYSVSQHGLKRFGRKLVGRNILGGIYMVANSLFGNFNLATVLMRVLCFCWYDALLGFETLSFIMT